MKKHILSLLVTVGLIGSASAQLATTDTFGTGDNQFSLNFMTIGNAGNAADTTGYGSVGYNYRIGTYEVSVNQINAASANGLIGVTAGSQNWNSTGDGPAFGISWLQAAAFVNYLNTSKGHQAAYNLSNSGGAITMALWQSGQSGYDPSNPFRNSLSTYFLPSENEWYKAAYYDPNKNSRSGGYWLYPTGSDSAPNPVLSSTIAGTAIYNQPWGPNLTNAASVYQSGGPSPYGATGMGGNVWEILESSPSGANTDPNDLRVERGGAWTSSASYLQSASRATGLDIYNSDGYGVAGFRVASVIPEPSTYALFGLGLGGILLAVRRKRLC
jgi:formylglycine-generating enzyme required for sulfatase activity